VAAKDPQTRRSAALGLGNVIGVAVAQEKKTRSLPAEFPANRQDLLSAAVLVTQAAPKGFDDPSPQVRGPCVDAVQQVSASLVDLIRDPFDPTKEYPPPGRPPTNDEAAKIRGHRAFVEGLKREF